MIEVGGKEQRKWWSESAPVVTVAVPDELPLREFDPRPLIGCDMIVIGMSSNDRLRQVVERICSVAQRMIVLHTDDPDGLGHVWERDLGWRVFGEGPSKGAA